jgi:nitrate/nitrite transport system substrate-binding protein
LNEGIERFQGRVTDGGTALTSSLHRGPPAATGGKLHIPSDLVVDQWTWDGESSSHRDFLFLHYSRHTYLLRYYLAEGGLHPNKDVQIRVVPPPEMVANLKAGNVDGYLAPDPFNQRAVYENAGFIFMLSKDIWAGHPCCAFAISHEFARTYPNTFLAFFKAIVDATYFASKAENRQAIAEAIAPKNYLNQPVTVLEQVLTGKYADGLGNIKESP